jgi:hypothetical protein
VGRRVASILAALLAALLCTSCAEDEPTTESACEAYLEFVNQGSRNAEDGLRSWEDVHDQANDVPALRVASSGLLAKYASWVEDGAPADAIWDGSREFTDVCVEAGHLTDG